MSESKNKQFRKLFMLNFKDKLSEAAQKQVTAEIQRKITGLQKAIRIISRQRDITFLVAIGLLLTSIIFLALWQGWIK